MKDLVRKVLTRAYLFLLVGALSLAPSVYGITYTPPGGSASSLPSGTAFPSSPNTNDVFVITDDSTAGACDSAGGAATTLCRWTGAAWEAAGDGVGSALGTNLASSTNDILSDTGTITLGGTGGTNNENVTLDCETTADECAVGTSTGTANLDFGAMSVESSGGFTGTASVAATGDSASAFFSEGFLEHEYGGLEEDVATYNGLLSISGGSTSQINDSAGIAGILSDETGTGAVVLGTGPTLVLPDGNGAAPTTDGQIKYDRTTERLQVGDGVGTSEFVMAGTLTDTKLCAWDDTGKEIDCDSDPSAVGADSIGTSELDDGADAPASGEYVRVDTVDQAGFEYRSTAEVLSDLGAESATSNDIDPDRLASDAGDNDLLDHEIGGLEADVNAYSGLVGIDSGATSEVDTADELGTMIGSEVTGTGVFVRQGTPTIDTPIFSAAFPSFVLQDTDMGGTPDNNGVFYGNCAFGTTAGGDEDCSQYWQTQVDGVLTTYAAINVTDAGELTINFGDYSGGNYLSIDADGDTTAEGTASITATSSADLTCTDCVVRNEIADTAMLEVKTQTITAVSDTIDCGSVGPVLVILDADADYTLTSNPQISAGDSSHLCMIMHNDATDSVTISDGNGVNGYGDEDIVLSQVGETVNLWYTGSLWQEQFSKVPDCTLTFSGGVPTLSCGDGYGEINVGAFAAIEDSSANCDTPDVQTVNSHRLPGFTCADGGSFEFTIPNMPVFTAIQVQTKLVDGGAGTTFAIDYSAQCRPAADAVDTTYGTGVAGDIDLSSSSANDYRDATTADITPNGTCSAGATLHVRGVIDDASHDASDSVVIGFLLRYQ